MKKTRVHIAAPAPLVPVDSVQWELCCICQQKGGVLICPLNNPVVSRRKLGYQTLASNLEKLTAFNYVLPSGRGVKSLNEGKGIFETFVERGAKFHKACQIKFLSPKFESLVAKLTVPAGENQTSGETTSNPRQTRSRTTSLQLKDDVCFICGGSASRNQSLRKCETEEIYINVLRCARALNDTDLVALLEVQGDLVAQEAKYHCACLARLYNRCRSATCKTEDEKNEVFCEGMAFAELVIFIRDKLSQSSHFVFRMGELTRMYSARVAQLLGVDQFIVQHTTRLREKILAHFPNLIAEKSGREYVLIPQGAPLLDSLLYEDQDDDALAFHRFARSLRRLLVNTPIAFSGSFESTCEEDSIPGAMLAAINTLLYGSPEIVMTGATRPALTICQLILLNMHANVPKGNIVRHRKTQEPPMPVYMALACYGRNREKGWIDEMHRLGVSVSSNRVMEITSQLCSLVVQRAKDDQVVCPPNLERGLFTVGALDNIDHKTTSSTSYEEFHGTGISVFQYSSKGEEGEKRSFRTAYSDVTSRGERRVPELPDFYAVVPDVVLPTKQAISTRCTAETGKRLLPHGLVSQQWRQEEAWLQHMHEHFSDSKTDDSVESWAAFHASREISSNALPAKNALLPLFAEKSSSVAMVKHGMRILDSITKHLNQDQVPVLCVDQPLFALAKNIQWNWPDEFGENQFVVLLGPLHIEMSFLRLLGDFLDGSGWVAVVANSGISTSGSAEAFLKANHVKKAREVHQITAAVLHNLMQEAYELENPDHDVAFDDWIHEMTRKSPTFYYWLTVLNLEILLLTFVRSIRQGLYDTFKDCLRRVLPWYFAFDHHNYSRWLSVHLKDLEELPVKAPNVHEQFEGGKFVVHKTTRHFSALGIDHAHEQNNAIVKGRGGAIGLTQDPSALRRWTIGGPEVSRLLHEFSDRGDKESSESAHHEQTKCYQEVFMEKCEVLRDSFLEFGNPFSVSEKDLIALDTRVVVSKEGVKTLYAIEAEGQARYTDFVTERLINGSKSAHDPIKKCSMKIFGAVKKRKSKDQSTIKNLRLDVQLFSRMFIVSTARDLDLEEFFAHENQAFPPSLSLNGVIRSGDKAHLVPILEKLESVKSTPSTCDGIVFDGAMLTHNVKPNPGIKHFSDYAKQLKSHMKGLAGNLNVGRLDIAWDLYQDDSLKSVTRLARGTGVRRHELPQKGVLPKNWPDYLRNDANKSELFRFLAEAFLRDLDGIHVVTNVGTEIRSSKLGASALHGFVCSDMEEADSRIFLHVKDMVLNGAKSVLVRSGDTDVVVLAASFFHNLQELGLRELWILFGTGRTRRYIGIHVIAEHLGSKAEALRGFHAFTGCDSVSFFSSRGKRSAWAAWENSETTAAFTELSRPMQEEPSERVVHELEVFTVSMYGIRDGSCSGVNEARQKLFASMHKPIAAVPPTRGALQEHIKRAAYQAGHIWGRALEEDPTPPPSPAKWGWTRKENGWAPVWTQLPLIWDACRVLASCGCTTGCKTLQCTCRRTQLPCTLACKTCKGDCSNQNNPSHPSQVAEEPCSDSEEPES